MNPDIDVVDAAAANRWIMPPPRHLGGSLMGALLLELGLVAGLIWWSVHRAPPPPAAQRLPVHLAVAPKPTPLPVTPQVPTPPMPTPRTAAPMASLPVLAVPRAAPLAPLQVPAALPPPPPAAGPSSADQLARYTAELNAAVQSGLKVTGMVRAMGLHGTASVLFELTPDGKLIWAKLARSSGMPPIDDAALARVRTTDYPPFPAALGQQDMTFQIEVKLSAEM